MWAVQGSVYQLLVQPCSRQQPESMQCCQRVDGRACNHLRAGNGAVAAGKKWCNLHYENRVMPLAIGPGSCKPRGHGRQLNKADSGMGGLRARPPRG